MKSPLLRATGAAAALVLGVATMTTPAAHAATERFDIRVELDIEHARDGAAVFEVKGVVPGSGYELTGDDLVANPSDWCGDLAVDVDPATRTLRVDGYDGNCDFSQVRVRVSSPTMNRLTVVHEALMTSGPEESVLPSTSEEIRYSLELTHGRGWAQAAWDTKSTEAYYLEGSATFTWAQHASRVAVTRAKYAKKKKVVVRGQVAGDAVQPQGDARVVLRKGKKQVAAKTVKVGAKGAVATQFKRKLKPGRYRVTITYTGSTVHTSSSKARAFRVRR